MNAQLPTDPMTSNCVLPARATRRGALRLGIAALGLSALPARSAQRQFRLDSTTGLILHDVVASPTTFEGRMGVKVELSDATQRRVTSSGVGNQPAFALLPGDFTDGTIQTAIAATVNGRGDKDARGFVGIAFHIPEDRSTYEAVYLRMTNGRLASPKPPAPRIDRAIQYTAHPDFHFDASRRAAPGRYERGADVAPATWTSLRLEIKGKSLRAFVGDAAEPALEVSDLRYGGRGGAIGLWVDDGTTGYFSDLRITPR
ncbi:hypothetical protein [Roseateles sp.]|uniref:hypothetical protein n=1 Tax=Roseateles sp. TaxID=1971397 RepID=UPI003D0A5ACA